MLKGKKKIIRVLFLKGTNEIYELTGPSNYSSREALIMEFMKAIVNHIG
jgi:hypothetical protein